MNGLTPIIQLGLIYGGLLSAFLTIIILGSMAYNAEIWLNDYPPDIRAKYGPASEKTRRQKVWFTLLFFLSLVVILGFGIFQLRTQTGDITFLPTFLFTFIVFMFFNLVDLLIIDWLVLGAMRPRFVVLPGTEGMAGYSNWVFPLIGFFKGSIGLLALSAVIAAVASLL
jgi:hypothetical protein